MTSPQSQDIALLVAEHTGTLLRAAMAMGFSEADAEELVQDAFVAYLKARERFEGRSSHKTFLLGILYNKGAELSRRRQKEIGAEDIEAVFNARFNAEGHWLADMPKGPEDAALSKELADIIAACAQKLSTDQRVAFFLKEAKEHLRRRSVTF